MKTLAFFLRLFGWFSLRHLRRHRGRAVMVLAGIALGAAVFTSVRISVSASLDAFTRSVDLFSGHADLVVNRPGRRVPETLVARLLRLSEVAAASAVSSTYVRTVDAPQGPFLLVGIDPLLDAPFRFWATDTMPGEEVRRSWITLLSTPRTLLAGASLAEAREWRPRSRVRLEHVHGEAEFTVAGVLADEGLAGLESGRMAITDMATFQELTGTFGAVDRIDLRIRGPVSDAMPALNAVLTPGAVLTPPHQARRTGREMIRAYQLNLSILSFASLFVGMFLVYSLVALNAASRRKELAILRAVGASSRLVFFLFLAEGAAFGLAGWLLALPASSVLVRHLIGGVSQTISTLFVRVQVDRLVLSPWEILLSFAVTVGVAVVAAIQPAREAMTVPPRAVLAQGDAAPRRGSAPARLAWGGLACIALVVPLAMLPDVSGLPLPGYLATALLFAGFAMVSPWGLRRGGRLAAPLLGKIGVPAQMAGRYVADSDTRTAVSVGALITAVALFTSLVIMVHSFRRTVEIWVTQTISGDLFAAARLAEVNDFRDPLPRDVVAALTRLSPLADLVPSRRYSLHQGRFPYQLEAMAMRPFFVHGDFFWLSSATPTVRSSLVNGRGVVISEVFANRTGVSVGDRFRADIGPVALDLPVVGVVRDYRTRGGVVFMEIEALIRAVPDAGWTGLRFYLKREGGGAAAGFDRLRQAVVECCGDRVDMVAGKSLRSGILRIFDETFAVTTVLLVIALVVAALGITTTLTVRVLERIHQLNTIAAVGGEPRQIRAMILWEAGLLVAAGEVGGLACGFLLSYLLIYVINRQSFGWTFLYSVDVSALAVSIPLIVATALAAALPALRAVFRQPPATLLRERQ